MQKKIKLFKNHQVVDKLSQPSLANPSLARPRSRGLGFLRTRPVDILKANRCPLGTRGTICECANPEYIKCPLGGKWPQTESSTRPSAEETTIEKHSTDACHVAMKIWRAIDSSRPCPWRLCLRLGSDQRPLTKFRGRMCIHRTSASLRTQTNDMLSDIIK